MLILDAVLLVAGAVGGFAGARVLRRRQPSSLGGLRGLAQSGQAAGLPRNAPTPRHPPISPPARPPAAPTRAIPATDPTRSADIGRGTGEARLERETPPGPAVPLGGRPFTVGRRVDRDLVLADDRVSRDHATFLPKAGGGWAIRDDGSSNGTRLNGHRIAAHADVPLRDGDRVTVGGATLVFREMAGGRGGPDATRVLPGGPR